MSIIVEFIDPRGKTFEYWSALMAEQLAPLGVTQGGNEKQWKDWARNMAGDNNAVAQGLPLPDTYQNWQDWAMQLLNTPVTF